MKDPKTYLEKDFAYHADMLDALLTEGTKVLYSEEDGVMLPIRTDDIHDLVTCVVDIPAGTTALTEDMVTDTRADAAMCGFMKLAGA